MILTYNDTNRFVLLVRFKSVTRSGFDMQLLTILARIFVCSFWIIYIFFVFVERYDSNITLDNIGTDDSKDSDDKRIGCKVIKMLY